MREAGKGGDGAAGDGPSKGHRPWPDSVERLGRINLAAVRWIRIVKCVGGSAVKVPETYVQNFKIGPVLADLLETAAVVPQETSCQGKPRGEFYSQKMLQTEYQCSGTFDQTGLLNTIPHVLACFPAAPQPIGLIRKPVCSQDPPSHLGSHCRSPGIWRHVARSTTSPLYVPSSLPAATAPV